MNKRLFVNTSLVLVVMVLASCASPGAPTRESTSVRVSTPIPDTPTSGPVVTQNPQETIVLSDEDIDKIVNRIIELEAGEPADPNVRGLAGSPNVTNEYQEFVNFVGNRVDAYWTKIFTNSGRGNEYFKPGVNVALSDPVKYGNFERTGAKGPFYYSPTKSIYMPLPSLYSELWRVQDKMTDFAQAFLIAHEWGHHIQEVVGIMDFVDEQEVGASDEVKNYLSQKLELQADCLAGTWTNSEYYAGTMEPGDLEEAIALALAIGDDVLSGKTDPATMDHGTGKLREAWFMHGYNSGDPSRCGEVWGTEEQKQTTPETPQITPTQIIVPESLVKSFFVLASDPSCKVVDDTVTDTLETTRCSFSDSNGTIIVDYDEWVAEQAWTGMVYNIQTDGQPVLDNTWSSHETGQYHGPFVAWLTNEGNVVLMWGVDGHRLTGTLYWYDGDSVAAQNWFLSQGSRHKNSP